MTRFVGNQPGLSAKIKDERAGEALWAAAQDEKVDKVKGQAAAALRN